MGAPEDMGPLERCADPAMRGSGEDCPACALRREDLRAAGAMVQEVPCNFCGGSGRLGRAVAELVREAVDWARREYWPERMARWGDAGAGFVQAAVTTTPPPPKR